MGLFAVIFSVVIVIIQTSSILMERAAHDWSYPLLKVSSNTTYLREVNHLFHSKANHSASQSTQDLVNLVQGHGLSHHLENLERNHSNSAEISYLTRSFSEHPSIEAQALCLRGAWTSLKFNTSSFPTFCLFNIHTKQKIESILADFNPHLILLILTVLHSTLTMAKMNKLVWSTSKTFESYNFENPHKLSVPVSFAAYCLLVIIVYVIVDGRNKNLMQYPTIILTIVLLVCGIWFIVREKHFQEDHGWFCTFYLHLVSIPTAVLSISLVGSRFWTDVVIHCILLCVAANILALERKVTDFISKKLCTLLYFFIPLFCLYMAHLQWGSNDNWKYSIGIMGCASLLPFFVYPIFMTQEYEKRDKHLSKIILFTSSGALVSLVINLAMFHI